MRLNQIQAQIDELEQSELCLPNLKRLAYLYIVKDHLRENRGQSLSNGVFGKEEAKEWTDGMRNADGTKGAHWTFEQAQKLMDQHGVQTDPAEFFAVVNSLYSDFDPLFKNYGVSRPDFYAALAKMWLEDDDAVPDKASAYWENIVRH